MLATLAPASRAAGQFVQQGERRATATFSVLRDAEAEAWLRKAREASQSQDWKLLADTLARVVEQYGTRTVGVEEGRDGGAARCVAAHREAWRILAQAGPAALAAYRLIYDAEAARLLDAARAGLDADKLRELLVRYRPTVSGTIAADLNATQGVDEGRWFDALRALDDLEAFPHSEIPQWTIEMRRAIACAAVGRRDKAAWAIEHVRSTPADQLPADIAARLAEIEHIAADPSRLARPDGDAAWPYLLGGSERAGRMAAVEPNLVGDAPRRVVLPDGAYIDAAKALEACVLEQRSPTWEAVSDGRTLFVGTPTGFAAFEPVSLSYRWLPFTSAEKARRQTPRPRMNAWMFQRPGVTRPQMELDAITARAVRDELSGTLAAFGGLVFCIEEPQQVAGDSSDMGGGASLQLVENSLAAYDATTGKLRWQKGRAGPIEDGLLDAHFFAAPAPLGERIAAVCRLGAELQLLVLTRDGAITERVPLGNAPESMFPAGRVLPMAVSDHDLIVQTGMGAVLCLDTQLLAVRWAASYPRAVIDLAHNFGGMRINVGELLQMPDGWLRNPPILRGDLVIVAPADSDELLALDRQDGRVRWRVPRGRLRYLAAADARRVYATGERIAAFSLSDGRMEWSLEGQQICGRAVLSGARLLVPTRGGLLTLASGTGAKLGLTQVGGADGPLGNLFVWDNALYSLEFNAVRRFADMSREFAAARQRLSAQPDDDAARMKLARIHLARKQWADALTVLDEPVSRSFADADGSGPQALRGEEADHLRIAGLLGEAQEHADAPGGATAQDEALLRRATELASRAEDVFHATLAAGVLDLARGRIAAAFERGLQALRRAGGIPITADGGYRARGGLLLGEQLRDAWAQCDGDGRPALNARADATLSECCDRGDEDAVRNLADALGFTSAGARADLWLAQRAIREGMPETAEFYLRRSVSRPGETAVAAQGAARLARLPSGGGAAASRRARDEEGDVSLRRGGVFTLPGSEQILGVWGAADNAEGLVRESAVLVTDQNLIQIDLTAAHAGSSRWCLDLVNILPEDERDNRRQAMLLRGLLGPAAVCGSVAAIPSVRGLQLVGLATGEAMCRPLTPPDGREEMMPGVSAVGIDGMFVAAIDPCTLVGLPARSGTTPAWRLSLGTTRIGLLTALDHSVAAVAADGSAAWVIAAATGRVRRRVALDAPEPAALEEQALLAQRGLVACRSVATGPFALIARGRELSAWRLATGEVAWRQTMGRKISDLRPLDAAHIAVCDEKAIAVLSTRDGHSLGRVTVKGACLPPVEAALTAAGQLIVVLQTDEHPSQTKLEWYNLASGERLVSHGPWPMARITPGMLRGVGGLIPVVRYDVSQSQEAPARVMIFPQGGGPQRRPRAPVASNVGHLALYNKQTGARVGPPMDMDEMAVVDVLPCEDGVIVVSQTGWRVYSLEGETR